MTNCWECGSIRENKAKCETCAAGEFVACVAYYQDADFTEIAIKDCAIVWGRMRYSEAALGYDMETGNLVAVRLLNGDYTQRTPAE